MKHRTRIKHPGGRATGAVDRTNTFPTEQHSRWENQMKTAVNLRRLAATSAVMATAVGAFSVIATPAGAATAPTARLNHGTVTVTGTTARDLIAVTVDADRLAVDFGFDGTVDAQFPMSRVQRLSVLAGEGDDGVSVVGTGVGDVPITISAGAGNDGGGVVSFADPLIAGDAPVTINGDDGNDNLIAAAPGPVTVNTGAGDDRVDGGGAGSGQEAISLGDGNDKYVSEPNDSSGARSQIVDGGPGHDTMETRGTFASESASLSANAGHLIVDHERDRIDADNIEDVTWFGFGGNDEGGSGDAVAVNDLSGTDVVNFTPDFSAPNDPTAPNNSADQLTVRATPGDDHIAVSGSGANITVAGLTPKVTPVQLHSDDTLRIDTLDGHDTIDRSGLQAGLVQLQVF
jgi:hypothetical protein